MTERVFALETEQEVVGVATAPVGRAHAVVIGAVAEEQQVAGHLLVRLGAVVEHFHIPPVGRRIGRAAAELMIELVGRHDAHRQSVALLVQLFDALCLAQPFLRGGDDNHHIHCRVGMVVLVHQTVVERGFCEDSRRETGHRGGRIAGQCQVVQAQVLAAGLGDGHRIVALFQVVQAIGPCAGGGLRIGIERHRDAQVVHHGVVHSHRTLEIAVIAQHHRQRPASAVALQGIGLRGAGLIERLVVKVPTAVIPGKVVHLIECVVVVVRGVVGRGESGTVERQRLPVALRQQIAATIRIRIACACEGILRGPGHRSHAIEEPSAPDGDGGHLLQVVGRGQVVGRQLFRLQGTAIAVDLHPRGVCEACLLHQRIRQLINAALRDTNLRPVALPQHRMLRIPVTTAGPPPVSFSPSCVPSVASGRAEFSFTPYSFSPYS